MAAAEAGPPAEAGVPSLARPLAALLLLPPLAVPLPSLSRLPLLLPLLLLTSGEKKGSLPAPLSSHTLTIPNTASRCCAMRGSPPAASSFRASRDTLGRGSDSAPSKIS